MIYFSQGHLICDSSDIRINGFIHFCSAPLKTCAVLSIFQSNQSNHANNLKEANVSNPSNAIYFYLHGTELLFAYLYNKRASIMFKSFSCREAIQVNCGKRSRNEKHTCFCGHLVIQTTHFVDHQLYQSESVSPTHSLHVLGFTNHH